MKLSLRGLVRIIAVLGLLGCGSSADETTDTAGAFLSSPDDEALDPSDPPTDPDPTEDGAVHTQSGGAAHACTARGEALSPKGLTFVLHVTKRADKAEAELTHLEKIKAFVRDRDIFMIERTSPIVSRLRTLFPCNRFDYIAYPEEMADALATGGGIDGIAVDWEGNDVESHSQAYSEERLANYARRIRAAGKQPGLVPSLSPRFDEMAMMKKSNMHYDLAQIQGSCVNGPARFAANARGRLVDFRQAGLSMRNLGFEISLDSFGFADNHVDGPRAATCTRAAYGKGVRAIYIYGNGSDHLVDYFHELGKMGVRGPR